MTVIFVLSFLLLLVVWVFTLIGLFSPKRVQSLWKGKELTRKDVAIGGVVSTVVLFVVIGLTAPDAEQTNTDGTPSQNFEQSDNIENEPTVKKFDFKHVDPQQPVARVTDINNDDEIIKSAGVPVFKTIDSTDSKGEPKKIYKFADFGTQIELSRSQIIIGWIAADDTESAKLKSQESIAVAQRLARAVLGLEAGYLVDKAIAGGSGAVYVDGYKVRYSPCIGGSCLITVER